MKTNKILALASVLFVTFTFNAFAEEKTFETEAVYHAAKGDDESTSRVMAVDQASKTILQAAVELVKADQAAEKAKAEKAKKPAKKKKGKKSAQAAEPAPPIYNVTDETTAIIAGIVPIFELDGKWDGSEYRLKANGKTETKFLVQTLRSLSGDKDEKKTLVDFRAKSTAQYDEITRLRKEIDLGTADEKTLAAYAAAVKELQALELFIRGYALGTAGKNEAAVKAFDACIEMKKDYVAAYTGRGYAYENMGKAKDALNDYNRAVELEPKNPTHYNNRGNVYDTLGDPNKAIDDYDQAIQLDPENAKAFSNRGTSYTEIGDYAHGLEDLNRAIQLEPNVAVVYVNRGILYSKMEDHIKALDDLKTAARMGLKPAQDILDNQNIKWKE